MPSLPFPRRRRPSTDPTLLADAITAARIPSHLNSLSPQRRDLVQPIADAIQKAATPGLPPGPTGGRGMNLASGRPPSGKVDVKQIAEVAAQTLGPSSSLTPADIEAAMRLQGMDWVEPFAPGKPLTPFYGYDRRPRQIDYPVGRNITTEPRDGHIPYTTLKMIWDGYDVAQICTRHIINDLRSMRVRFSLLEGEEQDAAAIKAARAFMRKPDGKTPWGAWLARWAMDVYRYDAGALYKQRNKGGKLIGLKVVDGTTLAPMLDYYGDTPTGAAPAYQQFIQGIPWDWLRAEDVVYQPLWPRPESPYGFPPIESVLINANTDVRLQWYFLNFFTEGQVPEAFATAPPDQSDPDSLAELQETYEAWTMGNQAQRYGLRFLPADTKITPYKPQQFDPEIAEYVMKRTVAAFGLVPQDLGFTRDVNRSTGDTQMDVQFRVNTRPNVGHFEALIDGVLQDDLGLPVEINFDTGREKEDRLMEAQAHQIYVSMGAESPDEVRDNVLALPIDQEAPIPRMFDSQRLGPVPLSYIVATSGEIDIETKAPKPGTVPAQVFVIPGAMQPDPTVNLGGDPAPQTTQVEAPTQSERSQSHAKTPPPAPSTGGPTVAQERTNAAKSADVIADELRKWRDNARGRVAKGRPPRPFQSDVLPEFVLTAVWDVLRDATTREQVDAVFAKATGGGVDPKAAGPDRADGVRTPSSTSGSSRSKTP